MEKGQFVELEITDMTNEGNGLGKVDGFTVFVENAIVGQTVRAGISQVKKNYAVAKSVKVLKESEFKKAEEFCPYIDKCGGCGYGKITYEEQLRLKEKSVKDKLERLGGCDFTKSKFNPIIPSDITERYRNKATIAVYNEILGFKEKKSNLVVDCRDCKLQDEKTMAVANELRTCIKEYKLSGVFSQVVIKKTTLDEMMVALYTSENKKVKLPSGKILEDVAYRLDDASGETLESIYVDGKLIAGKPTVLNEAGELKFEVSPLAFYQVNPGSMIKLYGKAMEYADLKGNETVLDLYCGVGTIGIFAAKKMAEKLGCGMSEIPGRVIGIESVKPAVIDANRNSVINGIVCTRYFAGKAEDELPFMMGMKKLMKPNEVNQLVERTPEVTIDKVDVAFIDPPRSGCEKDLLDAVVRAGARKLVYISCDPGTLARDVKYLREKGYELKETTPVDMFPNTVHVETVSLICKVNI